MNKVKIGLISFAHGHGYSYANTLSSLPQVEIVGVADDDAKRGADAAERYGTTYYADYRELLATDADAVVICSENAKHAEHTIAAAGAGKHVMCEKPLGITVEEMERMIAACVEAGVQLMTAFPCRFLAAVVRAKEAVDAGEIGDILAIKGTNRGSLPGGWLIDPALAGGGALLDHTVHVMDLMNWFTGSRVTDVYAYAATLFHEELPVDDAGMIAVTFENGVTGVLDTSWSRPKSFPTWGDVTMEIVGTKGHLSVDSFGQSNELYSDAAGKGALDFWGDSMDEHLVRAFVEAIRTGSPVPVTGTDGLRSAEVALAGYESVRQGQRVKVRGA